MNLFFIYRARHAAVVVAASMVLLAGRLSAQTADSTFAALVARLSEGGGFFDSDNIITNEGSYLQIADQLQKTGTHGGVYIGVGPDQNFSYIALLKPSIAFVLDIRRDNMLEHLLFKSLFELAGNRAEYLCMLLGRPSPPDVERWSNRPIAEILAYVAKTSADSTVAAATRRSSNERIAAFGVPLDARDHAMIDRYRKEFITSGLDTRYSSTGRNNRSQYPSFAQLITATDRTGHQIGYLADEAAYQSVRTMQLNDRIVPVVGNVAGDKAVRAVARYVAQHHTIVSAFYLSNVEQYLIERNQGFAAYVANVKALPHDSTSVIIRSYFGRYGNPHPLFTGGPGVTTASMIEPFSSFLRRASAGEIGQYLDLVMNGFIKP